jgi:CubicO group peptidase (beta-lactamase class C family)
VFDGSAVVKSFWICLILGWSVLIAWPAVGQVPTEASAQDPISRFENGLRGDAGTPEAEARWTLAERMAHYRVPGVSVAVIRSGKMAWARGYGVKLAGSKDAVDAETVFSVGSVSKVGAAATTLRLVDEGLLDLDQDVNEFLVGWKVPENEFTQESKVTLRRILSHTAGLTVHGFQDFQPGEQEPLTIDILEGRFPAKNVPVLVDLVPGTEYRYSGGGVTVEQLIVEEAMEADFATAAQELVFEPLEMTRSTFENPLPEEHDNIARAHNNLGAPCALPRGWESMPESAASGLWTTPSDFAKLIIALIEASRSQPDAFLSQSLIADVMTEVAPSAHGLGPRLDRELGEDNLRFSHGGSNESYKAWMEGHLGTGNGLVVFTNGARGRSLNEEIKRAVADAEGWLEAASPVGGN